MSNKVDLLNDDVKKVFLRYLIPSIGGMLGMALYVLADTMFVGRGIGSQGLAALNISIPIINVFNGLGLLFGIGGATALSVSRGQNREDQVNNIFTKSLIMAFIIGVIFTIIRIFFLEELCVLLGASGKLLEMSKSYLGALMAFSIAFLLNSALTVFVRNDKAPQLAMWAMLIGSITNVILDYIFIFEFKWGMWGAAVATGCAPIVGLIILSTHFIRKNNTIKLVKPKWDFGIIKRILSNGSSSFIIEISAGIVIFAFNNVILGISGDLGVSAYSIIANLSLVCTAIFTGVGQAIQPIVSINHGANKAQRVYQAVRLALYTSLGLGVMFYAIGVLFPDFLTSIFSKNNPQLEQITAQGIKIYFISFIIMGVNIAIVSYLQSIERAKISLTMSLFRGCIFMIIGLLILPRVLGLSGVWATLPFAEVITLVLSIVLFKDCREVVKYSFKKVPSRA